MVEVHLSGGLELLLRFLVNLRLSLFPMEPLGDLQGVLVEFIAEVPIEFQVERGQLYEELFEVHQVINAFVDHLVDLELKELGVLAVLAFENDSIVLANELVVDLDLAQLEGQLPVFVALLEAERDILEVHVYDLPRLRRDYRYPKERKRLRLHRELLLLPSLLLNQTLLAHCILRVQNSHHSNVLFVSDF